MYSYNQTELLKIQLTDPAYMKESSYKEYLAKVMEMYNEVYKFSQTDETFCSFYLKTGCCRYGDRCKKTHFNPPVSSVLLIEKFYQYPNFVGIKNTTPSAAFGDSILDMDENEDVDKFSDFYFDVLPELSKFGTILQFKCCNNIAPHLRGNVYVQYEDIISAITAYINLNGRFYAGNRLRIQFSTLNDWKIAICAYNGTKYCPKNAECNFLHIFKNPEGNKSPNNSTLKDEKSFKKSSQRKKSKSRSKEKRRKSKEIRQHSSKEQRELKDKKRNKYH